MIKSRRKEDNIFSNITCEYLDDNFYNKDDVSNFERITDVNLQLLGIDTIFEINNEKFLCDEKSAVRYRNLKTFSFELSFIGRNGEIREGWLINENLKTNSYLLFYIDKSLSDTDKDLNLYNKEDIVSSEIILLRKEDIIKYLESIGWTLELLREKAKRIRTNPQKEYKGDIFYNGCKFSFSENLAEKPINVLLSRDKLRKLSIFNLIKN